MGFWMVRKLHVTNATGVRRVWRVAVPLVVMVGAVRVVKVEAQVRTKVRATLGGRVLRGAAIKSRMKSGWCGGL